MEVFYQYVRVLPSASLSVSLSPGWTCLGVRFLTSLNKTQCKTIPAQLYVGPAKTQISLCIKTVWSNLNCALYGQPRIPNFFKRTAKTGQPVQMRRLTWFVYGRTHYFGGISVPWLICLNRHNLNISILNLIFFLQWKQSVQEASSL